VIERERERGEGEGEREIENEKEKEKEKEKEGGKERAREYVECGAHEVGMCFVQVLQQDALLDRAVELGFTLAVLACMPVDVGTELDEFADTPLCRLQPRLCLLLLACRQLQLAA
jgi:hypothetical protein